MIEMETFSEQQLQTDRQLLLTFDRGQVHLFPLWSSLPLKIHGEESRQVSVLKRVTRPRRRTHDAALTLINTEAVFPV